MRTAIERPVFHAVLAVATALGLAAPFVSRAADVAGGAPEHVAAPDMVLKGGRVLTPGGWVEALAIRGGVIVAVGSDASVGALAGGTTRTIELAGASVLPGLHDMHVHPMFAGLEHFGCGFRPAATPEEIAGAVAGCASKKAPGEWILGGNWVAAVFEPGQQTRALLDAAAPHNPVVLSDESHHSVWVNSRALEHAGISRDTPDPSGGIIERGADGEPNGLLRESAVDLIVESAPSPTSGEKRRALEFATQAMLSNGITSFTVASMGLAEIADFAGLSAEGVIKQRMRACLVWTPGPDALRQVGEQLIRQRNSFRRPRFKADCVKLFLDGVPTESQTAAMLQPYLRHEADGTVARPESGILMVPQETLDEVVADFDRQGLHIKFHAVGDAAVRAALDAVERARAKNGHGGPMHDIGHNSFIDPADIPRAARLGTAWEFSPYIWYPTPIAANDIAKVIGEERMERWIPIRDAVDTGALVVVGSDWSVVPSVNPWIAIETMVTREEPGGSDATLGRDQRVSLPDAYRMLTENAACLMGHRDEVGSIEVGMRADLVVTQQNLFDMPLREVHRMKVLMTLIDGEPVYVAE